MEYREKSWRIIIPKHDNSGRPLRPEYLREWLDALRKRFGGYTIIPNSYGCYYSKELGKTMCEENFIVWVVRDLNPPWGLEGTCEENNISPCTPENVILSDERFIRQFVKGIGDFLGQETVLHSEEPSEITFTKTEYMEELPETKVRKAKSVEEILF